jgi:DNA-binding transcriptional ArsR family regulator
MSKKHAEKSEAQQELLDSVFFALSDPIRRGIVERLQSGPLLVSELAEPFSISIQAVSRHIQVLEEASLVQKERTGRIRRCSLDVGPILDIVAWLNRYSDYWQGQFAQLSGSFEHGRAAREQGAAEARGGDTKDRAPRAKTSGARSRERSPSAKKAR